jgi:hypothetical protein
MLDKWGLTEAQQQEVINAAIATLTSVDEFAAAVVGLLGPSFDEMLRVANTFVRAMERYERRPNGARAKHRRALKRKRRRL